VVQRRNLGIRLDLWPQALRSSFASLKQQMRCNLGLRAIALTVALAFWFLVNASQRGSTTQLDVPLGYRLLPAGLVIVNQHPEFARIQIEGPRLLLSLIDPDRLMLRLKLGGVGPGEMVLKLSPEMFHVPRQTTVTEISPSQIRLDIDRVTSRRIPVRVNVVGRPAAGYRVAAINTNPADVTVRGPSRYLAHLNYVRTSSLDVSDARSEIRQMLFLQPVDDRIELQTHTVEVLATISEIVASRELRHLPVAVSGTDYRKFGQGQTDPRGERR
jgi:YbbR-like protein